VVTSDRDRGDGVDAAEVAPTSFAPCSGAGAVGGARDNLILNSREGCCSESELDAEAIVCSMATVSRGPSRAPSCPQRDLMMAECGGSRRWRGRGYYPDVKLEGDGGVVEVASFAMAGSGFD